MKTDRPVVYKGLKSGPACHRPDCGANCAYAGACKAQWNGSSWSGVIALALAATAILFAGYAILLG